jgi:hypothetical protein
MDFSLDHDFPAPPAAVIAVWCDSAFHTKLELPDLSLPEVVSETRSGATYKLELRYEFIGHLDPIAQKLLAGRKLTWLQTLELDTVAGAGTLTFVAEADPGRLFGSGTVALTTREPDGTHRHIDGELHVKVPLVGGRAERSIVPGIVRRLDVEAEAVNAALRSP